MPKLNHDFRAHSLLNSGVLLNSITTMLIKTAKLKTVSERHHQDPRPKPRGGVSITVFRTSIALHITAVSSKTLNLARVLRTAC